MESFRGDTFTGEPTTKPEVDTAAAQEETEEEEEDAAAARLKG